MTKIKELSKTEQRALQAIQEEPGLQFGLATPLAQAAQALARLGLVNWEYRKGRVAGWYLAKQDEKTSEPVQATD